MPAAAVGLSLVPDEFIRVRPLIRSSAEAVPHTAKPSPTTPLTSPLSLLSRFVSPVPRPEAPKLNKKKRARLLAWKPKRKRLIYQAGRIQCAQRALITVAALAKHLLSCVPAAPAHAAHLKPRFVEARKAGLEESVLQQLFDLMSLEVFARARGELAETLIVPALELQSVLELRRIVQLHRKLFPFMDPALSSNPNFLALATCISSAPRAKLSQLFTDVRTIAEAPEPCPRLLLAFAPVALLLPPGEASDSFAEAVRLCLQGPDERLIALRAVSTFLNSAVFQTPRSADPLLNAKREAAVLCAWLSGQPDVLAEEKEADPAASLSTVPFFAGLVQRLVQDLLPGLADTACALSSPEAAVRASELLCDLGCHASLWATATPCARAVQEAISKLSDHIPRLSATLTSELRQFVLLSSFCARVAQFSSSRLVCLQAVLARTGSGVHPVTALLRSSESALAAHGRALALLALNEPVMCDSAVRYSATEDKAWFVLPGAPVALFTSGTRFSLGQSASDRAAGSPVHHNHDQLQEAVLSSMAAGLLQPSHAFCDSCQRCFLLALHFSSPTKQLQAPMRIEIVPTRAAASPSAGRPRTPTSRGNRPGSARLAAALKLTVDDVVACKHAVRLLSNPQHWPDELLVGKMLDSSWLSALTQAFEIEAKSVQPGTIPPPPGPQVAANPTATAPGAAGKSRKKASKKKQTKSASRKAKPPATLPNGVDVVRSKVNEATARFQRDKEMLRHVLAERRDGDEKQPGEIKNADGDVKAAAAAPPLPYWICSACTLHNDLARTRCDACDAKRPAAAPKAKKPKKRSHVPGSRIRRNKRKWKSQADRQTEEALKKVDSMLGKMEQKLLAKQLAKETKDELPVKPKGARQSGWSPRAAAVNRGRRHHAGQEVKGGEHKDPMERLHVLADCLATAIAVKFTPAVVQSSPPTTHATGLRFLLSRSGSPSSMAIGDALAQLPALVDALEHAQECAHKLGPRRDSLSVIVFSTLR